MRDLIDTLETTDEICTFVTESIHQANDRGREGLAAAVRHYADTSEPGAAAILGSFIVEAMNQYALTSPETPPGPDPVDYQEPPEPDPYYEESKYEESK